ncbi:N-acetyltransferase [Dyella sp. LX-66]|uniref:GNAT family N-acetyltransferase n=1 Tax=unclassified Dyella TaxID=2634549 RepID=UPI001BDF7D1C|nr:MULTISPECIES: GNAT family N-acetyltransferase [unclassified Dyella]MBT2117931.1 N-acetyltransferase [Dyella sp. LX-1]MBT2140838.1 N-acetyltransferase [Dyella sp. LX-66]
MNYEIKHQPNERRFSTAVELELSVLDYTLSPTPSGEVMTITHTGVPRPLEGRGIASALVKAALDHARAQHWKVRPACSYADAWMRHHPEYEDLRAG